MMNVNRRYLFFSFFSLLSIFILVAPLDVKAANEDTAHLSFEKTATPKKEDGAYVVKKGDWIAGIIRKELGENVSYADVNKVIQQIRQLNPHIKNVNLIQPGQVLTLPDTLFYSAAGSSQTSVAESSGSSGNTEIQTEQKEPIKPEVFSRDEKHLAVLRQIISNMKGSLTSKGFYHIPLPHNSQVMIDCEKIPVVELDDGSAALIDLSNSMPDGLRKLIQMSWKNYHIINSSGQDNIAVILQKIINASKSYEMVETSKLLPILDKPQVQIYSNWVISKKGIQKERNYIQTLSFLNDESQLLPRPIVNYAMKKGLTVTEIVNLRGIMKAAPLGEIQSDITNLNAASAKALIFALLSTLDYKVTSDADVKVYNKIKDSGYNFTIKVDYLASKDDKQYIIHTQAITKEILDILKEQGAPVLLFNQQEKPHALIERLLQGMNVPFTYNTFSFTFPEKGSEVLAAINIPAFRITVHEDEPIFMIDFDMDNEISSLIQSIWRLKIIRY